MICNKHCNFLIGQRRPWMKEEKSFVFEKFSDFLESKTVPKREEVRRKTNNCPVIQLRSVQQIISFIQGINRKKAPARRGRRR